MQFHSTTDENSSLCPGFLASFFSFHMLLDPLLVVFRELTSP